MFPCTEKLVKLPKLVFDIFPKTDRIFNILSVLSCHVETIALLQKSNRISKPDTYVKLSLDMEDYYRIKDEEGGATIEPFSGKFCKSIKNIN